MTVSKEEFEKWWEEFNTTEIKQEDRQKLYDRIFQRMEESEHEFDIKGNVFYQENMDRYKKVISLCAKLFDKDYIDIELPSKEKPFVSIKVCVWDNFSLDKKNQDEFVELIKTADSMLIMSEDDHHFEMSFSIEDIWKEEGGL